MRNLFGIFNKKNIVSNPREWEPGDTVFENYQFVRKIADGASGQVLLFKDLLTSTLYAVKTFLYQPNTNQRKIFLRELVSWSALPQHPNLISFKFVKTFEPYIYIFLEYFQSRDLYNSNNIVKGIDQILDIAIQIAWGLQSAHSLHIVHQDIAPPNILINERNEVKITDFGCARAPENPRITKVVAESLKDENVHKVNDVNIVFLGEVKDAILTNSCVPRIGAHPFYASPEQIKNQTVTKKTDVYSWAVVVLELLLGRRLWATGSEAMNFIGNILEAETMKSLDIISKNKLFSLLQRALEENPTNRLDSIEIAAEEIIQILQIMTGKKYFREKPKAYEKEKLVDLSDEWKLNQEYRLELITAQAQTGDKSLGFGDEFSFESKKARGFARLIAYDDIRIAYTKYLASFKDKDKTHTIKKIYSRVCCKQAFEHQTIGDYSGAIYLYGEAIATLQELIRLTRKPDLFNDLTEFYLKKAALFTNLDNYDLAIKTFQDGLEFASSIPISDENETKTFIFFIKFDYGCYLLDMQRFDEAILVFEEVIVIGKKLSRHNIFVARSHRGIAEAKRAKQLHKEAIIFYKNAEELLVTSSHLDQTTINNELASTYLGMAVSFSQLELYQDSLRYYEKLKPLIKYLPQINDNDLQYKIMQTQILQACEFFDKGNLIDAKEMLNESIKKIYEALKNTPNEELKELLIIAEEVLNEVDL